MPIYARENEQKILETMLSSQQAEFLAIYGRRRVGKTFLIKEFFKANENIIFLKVTGLKNGLMREQITNFINQVGETFYDGAMLAIPKNWNNAFAMLHQAIKKTEKNKKIILFFDELPWMATQNSRLLEGLEYQWNQNWSDDPRIKLIACGSSSSWIVKKLIKGKGGFHNRVTRKIHLSPLTLSETKEFLNKRKIKLNQTQIVSLYMAMGGIPFYLMQVEKGLSATQIIEALAFRKESFLLEEFNNLFASLFDDYQDYIVLLRKIANTQYGIAQEDLLNSSHSSLRGERGLNILNELEESDFILSFKPHFNKKRGKYYRVVDEYTLFYFKWIEPIKETLQEHTLEEGYWQELQHSSEYHAWSGYAFEAVCYKHIAAIRKALKIPISAIADTWRYVPKKKEDNIGAQIDLLFDRKDHVITLCEIKYCNKPYVLTKDNTSRLKHKAAVFKKQTGTKKQLLWAFIAANGLANNFYAEEMVDGVVTMDDFFA